MSIVPLSLTYCLSCQAKAYLLEQKNFKVTEYLHTLKMLSLGKNVGLSLIVGILYLTNVKLFLCPASCQYCKISLQCFIFIPLKWHQTLKLTLNWNILEYCISNVVLVISKHFHLPKRALQYIQFSFYQYKSQVLFQQINDKVL